MSRYWLWTRLVLVLVLDIAGRLDIGCWPVLVLVVKMVELLDIGSVLVQVLVVETVGWLIFAVDW